MIQKSLAAKIGGGLAVAGGGGTGAYFAHEYYANIISKYDRVLVDYLNNTDTDIVFDVKAGNNENPTEDVSNSSFTFSSDSNPKVVVVKVSASSSSSDTFKKNGTRDEAGKKKVKKVNGGEGEESEGTDWTWKCIIKLTSDSTDSDLELEDKDKLFKEDGKGLFAILKKDYSNDTTNKKDAKKIKAKFVRDCGKWRGIEKNKSLNGSDSLSGETTEVSSSIEFALTKKTGTSSGNKLVPKDETTKSLFDHWFKKSSIKTK